MQFAGYAEWIRERALMEGFDLCGIARIDDGESGAPPLWRELEKFPEWLARGYAGEMRYLHDPRRADARNVMPGARSVIVVALNYNTEHLHSTDFKAAKSAAVGHDETDESLENERSTPRGWISRYAWGDDYHELLRKKMNAVVGAMRVEITEPFEALAYVDTGPIIERVAAKYAGLGWLAKNTCLINEEVGSFFFLGVIVT